ncbi:MAG: hypothetical protein KJ749_09695 [Planctomycetes bacterium]|nr:hypothetical protein [Planctomycetota bacterium]
MTNAPVLEHRHPRTVLFSHRLAAGNPAWLDQIDHELRSTGLACGQAPSGPETILQVERGGLAAAVVVEDGQWFGGLTLLRIIRSVDLKLPCWLIARDATRRTLETAFSLGVSSVMATPLDVAILARSLKRTLSESAQQS